METSHASYLFLCEWDFDEKSGSLKWCVIFSSQKNAIQTAYQYFVIQFNNVKCGSKAPNPLLHDLESKEQKNLLSISKKNRPLVINFGSCSWPPFMDEVRILAKTCPWRVINFEKNAFDQNSGWGILQVAIFGCMTAAKMQWFSFLVLF